TLGRFYETFSKRPELQAEAMKPVRKEFLTAALAEFNRFGKELGRNPRFSHERVRAMMRAAQIRFDLGEAEQARGAICSAIEEAEADLRADPTSLERQSNLLTALHEGIRQEGTADRTLALVRRAAVIRTRFLPVASAQERVYVQILQIYDG